MLNSQPDSAPNGIALYAKIASVLRTQIASGLLPLGQQLPSIERLSSDYKVAPVTVRQAVRLLVEEGLLSSHRGRGTFVTGGNLVQGPPGTNLGLDAPSMQVTLLEDVSERELPNEMALGYLPEPKYRWLRKLHHQRERMFFLMDAFVGEELQPVLPPTIHEGLMIIETFAEEFRRRQVEVVTTVNVSSADIATADLLRCALSFPVAQIARLFVDRDRRILVASKAVYRADVFQMQTRQTANEFFASRALSSVSAREGEADGTAVPRSRG